MSSFTVVYSMRGGRLDTNSGLWGASKYRRRVFLRACKLPGRVRRSFFGVSEKMPRQAGAFSGRGLHSPALFLRVVLLAATADLPHVGRFGAIDLPVTDDPLFIDQWIM